jgi:hypothetical protein
METPVINSITYNEIFTMFTCLSTKGYRGILQEETEG